MAGNDDGPWGGGSGKKSGGKSQGEPKNAPKNPWGGRPSSNEPPRQNGGDGDFDRIIRDGQERFRRVIGGGGGQGGGGAPAAGPSPRMVGSILIVGAFLVWIFLSFHIIRETDNAVVMRFGKHVNTWDSGLHFAPWPIYTAESENVTDQRVENIGVGTGPSGQDWSLMLTSDENIIDVEFDVVWNIKDLPSYKFNIQNPRDTIHAVAQSSMREVVARSPLIPLLNTGREAMIDEVETLIQQNLDDYDSGIDIVRATLRKSEPPLEVIADFEDVQAAEQERDKKQSDATAVAKTKLAQARGQEAQLLEDAEGYRAQAINGAQGDASRFEAVLEEYEKAPEVTRRRLYLETIQRVYSEVDKIIVDGENSQGVVPYLPLNELRRNTQTETGAQ